MFKVPIVLIFVAIFLIVSEASDVDPDSFREVAAHIGQSIEPTGT